MGRAGSHLGCGGRSTSARALRLVGALLIGAAGCAEEPGASVPEQREPAGELSLPLRVTSGGVSYRLRGTFTVRGAPDPSAPVVRALATDDAAGEGALRTGLASGSYYVFLEPGWRLEVEGEASGEHVAVTLATPNPLPVAIADGASTSLTFAFEVEGVPLRPDGELVIDVRVAEPPDCGNGRLERGERCDDGARNGEPGRCDAACRLVCTGACPLRVDPARARAGAGARWEDALADLQAALDLQAARGGGEVWVRGGVFPSLRGSAGRLLSLPSKVRLRGGFAGHERTPLERDPAGPRTVIGTTPRYDGDPGRPGESLLRIVDAEDVLVERVHLLGDGHVFHVEGSRRVTLRELSTEGHEGSEIVDSDVRIEDARFAGADWARITLRDARVAIVRARFEQALNPSGLSAVSSQVLLEEVSAEGPVSLLEGSESLVLRSSFLDTAERGGYVRASRATFVDSQFVRDGEEPVAAAAPLSGDDLFVWSSSFVRLRAGWAGGSYATASAIDAPKLEVAASSFFDDHCFEGPRACNVIVRTAGASPVHNSLFVHPPPGTYPDDPRPISVLGTTASRANCVSYEPQSFEAPTDGSGRVLARTEACRDRGNRTLLEAARKRLLERAKPFLGAPFRADLSRYASPDWWRRETTLLDACRDEGEPDPGRHFLRACAPAPAPAP